MSENKLKETYLTLYSDNSPWTVVGVKFFSQGQVLQALICEFWGFLWFLKVLLQSPRFIECMALLTSKTVLTWGTAGSLQKGFEQKREGNKHFRADGWCQIHLQHLGLLFSLWFDRTSFHGVWWGQSGLNQHQAAIKWDSPISWESLGWFLLQGGGFTWTSGGSRALRV